MTTQQLKTKKLRWGIISCANIGVTSVIPAIQESSTGEVVAISSRDEKKAKQTATELNIPRYYGSYEEILNDQEVDAVYIPLPNHLHKEWAIRAAEAGKHVLCEKPLALNEQEAVEMIEACSRANVTFAEAFMYRFQPRYDLVKQIIQSGEIGDVRSFKGAFTFNNAKDRNNIRFQSHMGGGSIYDVGCYPINASRYLLDAEPEAVTVHAFLSSEHDQVDMMAAGVLEYPKGVAATFECGMWADSQNEIRIVGTKGRIDIPSAFVGSPEELSVVMVTADGQQREEKGEECNQYTLQVDAFADKVLHHQPVRFPPEDSVRNMRVIDACLKSAKERTRVTL